MAEKKDKSGTAKNSGTAAAQVPSGEKPIRDSLVKSGVKNERIGWNNTTSSVTIDGKDVYKPVTNIDGKTYASDEDIREMTRKAYSLAGDELVGARDYVTSQGYSGIVNWDGENTIIGGEILKPVYVQSGISFIPKSKVQDAIAKTESKNGIIGTEEIRRRTDDKYGREIEDALYEILNRSSFSYNPDNDVAYQAYKEQYTREAEDALRRVLNDNNTSVTGASGAVLSEAMAMRDQALAKLTDKIPELVGEAYDRYNDETQRLYDNLDELSKLAGDYYDRMYRSDRDAKSEIQKAGAAEREESQRNITNERNRINDYYDNELNRIAIDKGNIDLRYYDDNQEVEYNKKLLENLLLQLNYETKQVDYAIRQLEYEIMLANPNMLSK